MRLPLFIKWQESNETGIELIDEQHKGILSIINTFYYMMANKVHNHMMYSCISDTLKNYSRIHFITEEDIIFASRYPDFAEHKKLHQSLTLEIEIIEHQGIRNNDAGPLLEFLKKWWLEHINEKDRLYVPFLKADL
jgi:hemerythrin